MVGIDSVESAIADARRNAVCCVLPDMLYVYVLQVAAVVGIDNVESAIADARVNAEINGITNATFVCGAAEHVMENILEVSWA